MRVTIPAGNNTLQDLMSQDQKNLFHAAVCGNSYPAVEVQNVSSQEIFVENGTSAQPGVAPGNGGKSLKQDCTVNFNYFKLGQVNIYAESPAEVNLFFS